MNPVGGELLMGLTTAQRPRIGNGNTAEYNTLSMSVGSGRRKSLSYHPPQLSLKSNDSDTTGSGAVTVAGGTAELSSAGRFSPHPNELFLPQSVKLTIAPQEKFDETLMNSCLHPPPSPAPNSDSHMTGHMQPLNLNHFHGPSQTHIPSHVHSQVHSHTHSHAHSHPHSHSHLHPHLQSQIYPLSSSNSISSLCTSNSGTSVPVAASQAPHKVHNVRSMSPNSKIRLERYREPGQKSPALSGTSTGRYYPMSSVGSNYLATTVHTPVKRYVPTPPATADSYAEQYVNMPLAYNYRAKSVCCHLPNETESVTKSAQTSSVATSCACSSDVIIGISPERQSPSACSPKLRLASDTDSMVGLQTSTEGSTTGGTCLHCNTTRRTTGVHQTTQTTGPISPVPVAVHLPHTPLLVSAIKQQQQHQERDREQEQQQQQQLMMTLSPAAIAVESRQASSNGNTISFSRQPLYSAPQQALQMIPHQQHPHSHQQQQQLQQQQQQQPHRYSCKKRLGIYMRCELSRFFGVELRSEESDFALWHGRHRRLAIRRFGSFTYNTDVMEFSDTATERPDILPAQQQNRDMSEDGLGTERDFHAGEFVERKATVAKMFMTSFGYIINMFNRQSKEFEHGQGHIVGKRQRQRQWSRSFAPIREQTSLDLEAESNLASLIEDELFFDMPSDGAVSGSTTNEEVGNKTNNQQGLNLDGVYMSERHHNGWRTTSLTGSSDVNLISSQEPALHHHHQQQQQHQAHLLASSAQGQFVAALRTSNSTTAINRGSRITAQLLDGVLENSRRPQLRQIKYFSIDDLDDRTDHRPFFTYWINTVHIVVLILSLVCYGIAPIGLGVEQKTGQVLVTSLSLQTVQHVEQRNLWIGPRNNDLVHMGAKFSACMRRDIKIIDVLTKTRRQERETACCIRNDDSGCVQSSQADCSIRGLYPTKSISTWKKWSPGESGPGGRISGSVCGLDPKFCDAPASIAPYEWPDDITKWPICRKTNSFSQRYRYKDHTAEHMVCEVIGHPCCTGLYGECRITTREYCDFINGYFHEEASLCSQISCLNNVCGMFPFISLEIPDQIYRLLTSLCMHAGVLHLVVTLIFQHLFLADLERLIGTIRTAIVYIMSGMAGNLTSAVFVPHRPEVGPSASLCGVVASLLALLIWMHWKHLQKPYVALFKLLVLCSMLFGIGTLPYQLNFAGLMAGVACGAFLTISLVPFASFTKYERTKKINLIWTCILFHVFMYTMLFATFYIYPSEFSKLNFIDDLFGSENENNFISVRNGNHALHNSSDIISSTSRRHAQTQKPQFYYHHHSEDIIRNNVPLTQDTSISHIFSEPQHQKRSLIWTDDVYKNSFSYNSNSGSKFNYSTIDQNMRRIKETFDLIPSSSALNQGYERISNKNKKNNNSYSFNIFNKPLVNLNNIANMSDTNLKAV